MKTKFIYAILAIAVLSIASCSRDEDSLFDKNPTERANEAMSNILTTLPAAPNGWDMVYFANPESEGYHVLVKFNKDGRAVVAAKNSKTTRGVFKKDSTSAWSVLLDYGPILTFNTYNQVMHAWSDPQNDGIGYEGDYEFLILGANRDIVKLKGKKHSAYVYLRPLAEGLDWTDFYSNIETLSSDYLGNSNFLVLNKNGKTYMLYPAEAGKEDGEFLHAKVNAGLFSLAENNTEFEGNASSIYPYVLCEGGIQTQFGFLGDKKSNFYQLMDNGQFVAEDGSTISAGNLNEYFGHYVQYNGMGWTIQPTDLASNLQAYVDDINDRLKSFGARAKMVGLRVKYKQSKSIYEADKWYVAFQYTVNGTKIEADVDFEYKFSYTAESVSLEYVAPVPTRDNTAEQMFNIFPTLEPLMREISSTYVASTDYPVNPTKGMRLTSSSVSGLFVTALGTAK